MAKSHTFEKGDVSMTRTFDSYTMALEFADFMSDRYETKVINMGNYYLVVCER